MKIESFNLRTLVLFFVFYIPIIIYPQMRLASLGVTLLLLTPFVLTGIWKVHCTLQASSGNWSAIVFSFVLLCTVAVGLGPTIDRLVNSLSPIIEMPNATLEEKLKMKWGDYYGLIAFAHDYTPPNALIVLPPSEIKYGGYDFWPAFVQAYVYPRQVVQGTQKTTCSEFKSVVPVSILVVNSKINTWPQNWQDHQIAWYAKDQAGILICTGEGN